MSLCVLDTSATFPWLFEDETSPATDALLDHVTEHGAVVPVLWFLECTNGLAMAERRGRINGTGIAEAVALLLDGGGHTRRSRPTTRRVGAGKR